MSATATAERAPAGAAPAARGEIIPAPHQAPQPVRQAGQGPPAAQRPAQAPAAFPACPHLSGAVAAARDRCRTAAKGGFNEFHKYHYAEADEVIAVGSEAMAGSGLALIPARQELTALPLGAGGRALYALNRTLILSHSSGEFVPVEILGWPVIEERGRALDKAFATALTGSLAYAIRDLLQMPRGAEHDMSAREDRGGDDEPPPPRGRRGKATAASPFDRAVAFEGELCKRGLCAPGDLTAHLRRKLSGKYAGPAESWPQEAEADVGAACREFARGRKAARGKPTDEQLADLDAQLERTGQPWRRVLDKLEALGMPAPAGSGPAALTARQVEAAAGALAGMPDREE